MPSPDPVHRCLRTAAVVTLAIAALAAALAALAGDPRILRAPVFMAVLALAGGAGAFAGAWRGLSIADEETRPGILLCALAVSAAAWNVGYLHAPSDDYRLYETAARQWLAGHSLYSVDGHNQLPTALVFLGWMHVGLGAVGGGAASERLWQLTYYVYELGQLLSVIAIVGGLYLLAQAAGAQRARAGILAGLVGAMAFPIRESIGNNQLNLPVLALALPALAGTTRQPALAGAMVAVGGAIKLYPFALLLSWIAERRWRALGATVATLTILLVVLWPEWVGFAGFAARTGAADAYRHVGLHAIVMNTTRELMTWIGHDSWQTAATGVWLVTVVSVAGWAIWLTRAESGKPPDQRRMVETSARVLAAVLLVFPLAWAHHFIFAVPLAICLWARGSPRPRHIVGTALILFVPAFDIYPLGLHRLVGLGLLLVR